MVLSPLWLPNMLERKMRWIKAFIRFLERHGVLVKDEPWVPPTHKHWYYHCWYPPTKTHHGGYGIFPRKKPLP